MCYHVSMTTVENLWVDDDRRPPRGEDWTWVKTSKDAIAHLEAHRVTHLSLDYSLGYMCGNTGPVIKWMQENYFPDRIDIHSGHPQGRDWLIKQVKEHAPGHLGSTSPAMNSSFLDDLI